MAETKGRSEQARRAESRAKRRAAADQHGSENGDVQDASDLLLGAASAAIAGAAVGAAQAIARRREEASAEPEPELESEPQPEPDEPEESARPPAANEAPAAPVRPPAPRRERKQPMSDGEARDLVDRARDHLRQLRGVEAESVSSVARTPDGWRIGLEVVEVHRIPESTDVLATYEVEVDSNGDLLTYQRKDRYTRSEADRR